MIRGVIAALFAAGLGLLAAPFLLSSLAVDAHGVTIRGRVVAKRETIRLRYTTLERTAETTIQFEPPDEAGEWFYKLRSATELYDRLRVGEEVRLHYLLRRDTPAVPMADTLRQMRALPLVRLAERETFSALRELMTEPVQQGLAVIAGVVLVLIVLRKTGSTLFPWAAGLAFLVAIGAVMLHDFPRPTQQPSVGVRQITATVKSVDRIIRIFAESRSKGLLAGQPVDVVGVEFVPEGGAEPVLAADLIDAGSVAGLGAGTKVEVEYERDRPRRAWIVAGRREFVSRNVAGILLDGALGLGVVIVFTGVLWGIGRVYRGLVAGRG